jgi:hypothetical protein
MSSHGIEASKNHKPRHTHNVVGGETRLFVFYTAFTVDGKDTVQAMCVVVIRLLESQAALDFYGRVTKRPSRYRVSVSKVEKDT